jgi:small-conductance mechanosensitive channel
MRILRSLGLAGAILLGAFAGMLTVPGMPLPSALAQGTSDITFNVETWTRLVERAENTISRGVASDSAFMDLRQELVAWRSDFDAAKSTNAARIRTVEAQIEALGPPPGEGASEPDAVAGVRADLNSTLNDLMIPVRAADVAFNRADALIHEIDQILRTRQTETLFQQVGSPLLPATWSRAWNEFLRVDLRLRNEILAATQGAARAALLRERAPIALLLAGLGFTLIFLGRRLMERVSTRVAVRQNTASGQILALILSLGQVILPIMGLGALAVAAQLSLATGFLGQSLTGAIVRAGATLALARWLAVRIFPPHELQSFVGVLTEADRSRARRVATILGGFLALYIIVGRFGSDAGFSPETMSVLKAPLVIAAAWFLWRMGSILMRASQDSDTNVAATESSETAQSEATFLSGVLWVIGQALHFLAVAGPLAAVIGYANLAAFAVFPAISSLGIIAIIATLHRLFGDLYSVVTNRSPEDARDALVPVLMTLLAGIGSIPLFALVWGARWTEITDAWESLSDGFMVGGTRIGIGAVVTIVAVFAIGFGLTRLLQATLRSAVLPRTKLDQGGRNAITVGVGYVGLTIAALAAITAAGINLTAFALVASALSVGIGFGLRTVVENFVAGLIMLIERPISEGDWIEVGPQMGIVKNISVRATTVQAFDRSEVIIPNGDLIAGVVTNYTRGSTVGRLVVAVGVSYDCDSRHVERVLMEICENHPLVAMDPPPRVMFRAFGDNALEMECFCILRDVNFRLQVHSDINHSIHERFREEGIGIPFPQRDLWLRNPEVLPGAPLPAEKAADTAPEDVPPPGDAQPTPDEGRAA